MGDDISASLLCVAVWIHFRSTNVVQLSNRNPYFYRFQCHHPLITQLSFDTISAQELFGKQSLEGTALCGTICSL